MHKLTYIRNIVINHLQPLTVYGFYHNVNQKSAFNIEHIIPQSIDKRVNCDLHTIFMSDREINRIRSNYQFIDNDKKYNLIYISYKNGTYRIINQNGNKNGDYYCAFSNKYSLFLPPENSKGIIARSLLYYIDKYKNSHSIHKIIDIQLLHKWNNTYLVSEMEYIRNEEIFSIQKSRNPFIYFG